MIFLLFGLMAGTNGVILYARFMFFINLFLSFNSNIESP
jgi:hypothetical protein